MCFYMCILFGYINNEAKRGEYKLIIGNSREEEYDRPTALAGRWVDDTHCIGGKVQYGDSHASVSVATVR